MGGRQARGRPLTSLTVGQGVDKRRAQGPGREDVASRRACGLTLGAAPLSPATAARVLPEQNKVGHLHHRASCVVCILLSDQCPPSCSRDISSTRVFYSFSADLAVHLTEDDWTDEEYFNFYSERHSPSIPNSTSSATPQGIADPIVPPTPSPPTPPPSPTPPTPSEEEEGEGASYKEAVRLVSAPQYAWPLFVLPLFRPCPSPPRLSASAPALQVMIIFTMISFVFIQREHRRMGKELDEARARLEESLDRLDRADVVVNHVLDRLVLRDMELDRAEVLAEELGRWYDELRRELHRACKQASVAHTRTSTPPMCRPHHGTDLGLAWRLCSSCPP